MGFFHSDIGSEPRIIRIHHRRLRNVPLPNSTRYAHWALQVGDYFYEVAAPPKDFLKLILQDGLNDEIQSTSEDDDQDYDDNQESDDSDDTDDDSDIDADFQKIKSFMDNSTFSDEDNYKTHTDNVCIELGDKIPLQISKGNDWQRIDRTTFIDLGTTDLRPAKITERARHIYRSSFKYRYDFYNYNCHAFVLELFFSIRRIDHRFDKLFRGGYPGYEGRNWWASILIYGYWLKIMKLPHPPRLFTKLPPTTAWTLKEKYINYDKVIPPQAMHRHFNPIEPPPSQKIRHQHHATKHVQHRSHAAHASSQADQTMMQNIQNQIVNAAMSQQVSYQAASYQAPVHSHFDSSMFTNIIGIGT